MKLFHTKVMQILKLLKEKKEREKKEPITFSLSSKLANKVKELAEQNGISHSDIAEYALKTFIDSLENDLESYAEMQQEAYQTGVTA